MTALRDVLAVVGEEVQRAQARHAAMQSDAEGYSVLIEEVAELAELVRGDAGTDPPAIGEAIQVAAMGLRYVIDRVPEHTLNTRELVIELGYAAGALPPVLSPHDGYGRLVKAVSTFFGFIRDDAGGFGAAAEAAIGVAAVAVRYVMDMENAP